MQLNRPDDQVMVVVVANDPFADVGSNGDEEMSRLIESLSLFTTTSSPSSSSNCSDTSKQLTINFKCNNQTNSKDLQNIFESNPTLIKTFFKSILNHCGEMIGDPYGNYLLTSIIQRCDNLQRYLIINRIASKVLEASMTISGSRCLQHLIEASKDDQPTMTLLWKFLKPEGAMLCSHPYGNHCIQKLLKTMNIFCFPDLIQVIIDNFKSICLNRYGSYVIQRCFDAVCEQHPFLRMEMMRKLNLDIFELSTTRVGNYVAQYLISHTKATDLDLLLGGIEGKVVTLACDSFGSNVLESLLMRKDNTVVVSFIVNEMVRSKEMLYKIISDRYGQYCMEKAIKELSVSQQGRLLSTSIVAITPFFIGTFREQKVIKTLHEIWTV
jgi:hypothetical protein